MTNEQMAALGLTRDPAETGLVHDVYARSAGGPYYMTAGEWQAVKRRMRQRERHREQATASEGIRRRLHLGTRPMTVTRWRREAS